jgi:hypothetical protein
MNIHIKTGALRIPAGLAALVIMAIVPAFGQGQGLVTSVLDDFEPDSLTGWTLLDGGSSHSTVSLVSDKTHSGNHALQWTFTRKTNDTWKNQINKTFITPQDWTAFDTISFYIKADSPYNNQYIYMKVKVGDSWVPSNGIARFTASTSEYTLVSVSLGDYAVENITGICFYVNAEAYSKDDTVYNFYIDDIVISGPATAVPELQTWGLAGGLCALALALATISRKRRSLQTTTA